MTPDLLIGPRVGLIESIFMMSNTYGTTISRREILLFPKLYTKMASNRHFLNYSSMSRLAIVYQPPCAVQYA